MSVEAIRNRIDFMTYAKNDITCHARLRHHQRMLKEIRDQFWNKEFYTALVDPETYYRLVRREEFHALCVGHYAGLIFANRDAFMRIEMDPFDLPEMPNRKM